MAVEPRPELVGRRFLCVRDGEPLELGGISRWSWRAGVIRAVTTHDTENPAFSVCVDFDEQQLQEREQNSWLRIRDEFRIFLLEQWLVLANRNAGNAARNSGSATNSGIPTSPICSQPALSFCALIGQACLGAVKVVEFLQDRQLEFCNDATEPQRYQEEADPASPPLRDDPALLERVQAWLTHQKIQSILTQGQCSLTGQRVRVYRPDSAPQWLPGIITHQDQSNRSMTIMSDQVKESLQVDPWLVQLVFVDDVLSSLTESSSARRKVRPSKTSSSNTNHQSTTHRLGNTTATDQAGSSGQRQSRLHDSSSSPTQGAKEDRSDERDRGDLPKSKTNYSERKRRKEEEREEGDEEERRGGAALKRLRGSGMSEQVEEPPRDPAWDGPPEPSHSLTKSSVPSEHSKEAQLSQDPAEDAGRDLKKHPSPYGGRVEPTLSQLADVEGRDMPKGPPPGVQSPDPVCNGVLTGTETAECVIGPGCGQSEQGKREDVTVEMEDRSEGASREDSEAVSALLASQEDEQLVSMETTCVMLHTSPAACVGTEVEQETPASEPEDKGSGVTLPEVVTSLRQSEAPVEVEEEPSRVLNHTPIIPCKAEDAGKEGDKACRSPCTSNLESELTTEISHKPWVLPGPCSSPEIVSKTQAERDTPKSKQKMSSDTGRFKETLSPPKAQTDTSHSLKSSLSPKASSVPPPNTTQAHPVIEVSAPPSTPNHTRARTPNRTPNLAEPTKSPLLVDRSEPFTVYRDPVLVRAELESHPCPRNPHPKHHHKSSTSPSSSTSSGTSSLPSAAPHPKLLGSSSHPTPPSPVAFPATQPPLCSLSAPPHHAIPHPHLLPSLLPALSPSAALLAGHPRLASLALPPHPLALQAGTTSLLGQTAGSAPLAPLGLYPFLWPPFPNGAHHYAGLGLQVPKWTHPEGAGISEGSLRANPPSPWLPQPTPVSGAEGQGLRAHLPMRPASADPHRTAKGGALPGTPPRTTEELERRAVSELPPPKSSVPSPYKPEQERVRASAGKNGHAQHHHLQPDTPSHRPKAAQSAFDLPGDRGGRYQEESRRILQESIEVAPFTAKLGPDGDPQFPRTPSSSLPLKERERDREREREVHRLGHLLPPRPQSAHPSPSRTQSNYYTSLCSSVESEPLPRRLPASKELYDRLSSGGGVNSVSGRPPPLVKRHPEKEEGLLGKITERLALQATTLELSELSAAERKGLAPFLISSGRDMPSLHRAPIFHPPAMPIHPPKEAGHGRLSPPTLTPIQPMNSPGKAQSQQRPPTLLPELRHAVMAGKKAVPEAVTMTPQAYDSLRCHIEKAGVLHSRENAIGCHTVNGGAVRPQSATASVIVRPNSYHNDKFLSGSHSSPARAVESISNLHSKEGGLQYKKGVLWTPVDTVHPLNMTVSKSELNMTGSKTTTNAYGHIPEHVAYPLPITVPNTTGTYSSPHPRPYMVAEQGKEEGVGVRARPDSSPTNLLTPWYLPHLKKHTAGLAAAECRHNPVPVQPTHTTPPSHPPNTSHSKHGLHTQHNKSSAHTAHATHTVCPPFVAKRESGSICSPVPPKCPRLVPLSQDGTGATASKPISGSKEPSLPPAPSSQPAQMGQNNYHKLKKAWLTRHSEQDRGSASSQTAGGAKTDDANQSRTPVVSQAIKQELNGMEESWPNQEDRAPCLDNRNTKTVDKNCVPEEVQSPVSVEQTSSVSERKLKTEETRPNAEESNCDFEDRKLQEDRKSNTDDRKSNMDDRTSTSVDRESTAPESKQPKEVRGEKRTFESSSETDSGGDSGNESESHQNKRQPKPTFKKKQNDLQKKRGDNETEEEEEEAKLNGTFRSAKEKTRLRVASSNGIPRSVLKDWRKVRRLKQSGEAFLQDDSCAEIGPNVQKCRECRLDRTRKTQEPVVSPVFCRFYYFRRLSYSKNGVVRVDGFSVPEQTDEEAVRVWMAGWEDEDEKEEADRELDPDTAKYILALIGDKFCQLVQTENTAVGWIKKDTQIMWKRAVRSVREMCDACEATLFNMHWACHKCGFVVCMDCYKARERKSAKDKELYAWVRCVKNQPHDLKNLMPTQIVPDTALAELQGTMHALRDQHGLASHCHCAQADTHADTAPAINGVPPVAEGELGEKDAQASSDADEEEDSTSLLKATSPSTHPAQPRANPPRRGKTECDHTDGQKKKSRSPEQGSTLRDLLTSTAGKLCLASPDAGMAFAPVYNSVEQTAQSVRMPNILDDIIASVVENKIPASKMAKLGLKHELTSESALESGQVDGNPTKSPLVDPSTSVPHDWLGSHRLLWLKDHRHQGNQRLFRENWTREQPVLVSGFQKSLNPSLWRPETFSREFVSLHSDLYNCRDASVTNARVKEFWDGFEDVTKRAKCVEGDPAVYRLKDWPSGDEFMALMPSRYDDVMGCLPVPDYCDPEGRLNLAARLPAFFVRPDLGPRLCCAQGVTACPEQDFGTSNLHVEISDTISILAYVGVAKGTGALSKTGVLKLLEREALDESVRRRLRDPGETPGALWHIFRSKDLHKIQEFLQTVSVERGEVEVDSDSEWEGDVDPLREAGWYLSPRLRQRLQQEKGVESHTLVQFHGDAVIIPAGALHQVINLHSCIQVNLDFLSPEHAHNSYYLTQELRPIRDQVNYEDKLQVKNIFYHSVKDAVDTLSKGSAVMKKEEEEKPTHSPSSPATQPTTETPASRK